MHRLRGLRSVRRPVAAVLLATLLTAACEAGSEPTPEPGEQSTTPTRGDTEPDRELTFGVFGPPKEVAAYESLVAVYNSLYEDAEMSVESYPSREAFLGEVRETGEVPDVFLTPGRDLAWLTEEGLVQPVDTHLIERGVDFGDVYSRDAVLAFSSDTRLQCMPVGISPMVIYYNTDLVDFERMENRELPVPGGDEPLTWNWEEFTAAVEFASRPRRNTRGIHVAPTLEMLAPFIYAGGGELYDDPVEPTSLRFSDDGTREALETVLEVFRDPRLTLSEEQLKKQPPLEWFKRGKLAMIPGFRDLTPVLRQVTGLEFDVIAIPNIERSATVGEFSGMCISADTGNLVAAADFLVHMASPVSVRRVASEGYLVPANLEVALGPGFQQPGLAPEHANVFTNSMRTIVQPPMHSHQARLEHAVADLLDELLTAPIMTATDLEEITTQIDEASRPVFDPEAATPGESETDSESP